MNRSHRLDLVICLVLALATVLVYWDIFSHQFVIIDDPVYVAQNPYVQSGLTPQSVKWAFTTTKAEFWHPLTWLSYMLDTQMLGARPAGYLFTNLLLHVLNAILVFLLFSRMAGAVWQSAFVAALFALHPLHVESVAWIAERKDVLSAFFWMLTTYFYCYYVNRPGYKRYLTVCLFLTLGLMAKPMLVTLPFVLLLLDYWPLGRFKPERPLGASIPSALFLIREKIPLFIITAVFSLTTFLVQKTGGGISSAEQYSFTDRIYNAIISYTSYMWKMIWPHRLAVFYPFPDNFPIWKVGGAVFLLMGITILAFKSARRYPFFIVGWLWYMGTLFPVIGLIKIGDFSMADRYMYIPMIGLAIIIAWGVPVMLARIPVKRIVLATAGAIALAGLTLTTYWQVKLWTNSLTLFEHALQVTEDNFFAHYGLGHVYSGQGKYDAAITHFSKAVHINPTKVTLYNDLGRSLAGRGNIQDARIQFLKALEIKPHHPAAHFYLANILVVQNQFNKAIYHFSEALRLHPDYSNFQSDAENTSVPGYHKLLSLYNTSQRLNQDINYYQKILADNSQNADALRRLAIAYSVKGDYDNALALLQVDKSTRARIRDITRGYADWRPLAP
jgi:thioredoxin-like negative regulator of GroEL